MHLIVESKPFVWCQPAPREGYGFRRATHEHHFAVELVKVDDTMKPIESALEQVRRDLGIGHARDQGTCINQCRKSAMSLICDVVEHAFHRPVALNRMLHILGRCQYVDNLAF